MSGAFANGGFFWMTSRAAGIAALVLSSAAVGVGLASAAKWIGGERGRDLRPIHEALSLSTLVAVGVHGLALLGDTYVGFSIGQIAIPFQSNYRPFWTGLGVIAGWSLIVLGLGYYARARIGVARWRALHRFTAAAWLLGIVHALGSGTDAGTTWFLVMAGVTVLPAALMLVGRWTEESETGAPPRPRAAAER